MTSARHWVLLGLALLMACPPSSAEAEPKAEAAAEADPEYDADASTRSTSRFGQSRTLNLGLTRDNDYQAQSRTNQFGTTNQFGLNSQLGSTGYQPGQIGANRFGGSNLVGTSQFGSTGLRNNQFGTNQFGTTGLGSSQFGTTGVGTNRFGTGGIGSSQFGTTGAGASQFGTGVIGSTQFGTTGTGTSQFGTSGIGSTQFGTTGATRFGAGLGSSQFGTTGATRFGAGLGASQFGTTGATRFGTAGIGSTQLGTSRFGTNQFGNGALATSRFGASALTSNNQFGTNQFGTSASRNNQFGTTGLGVGTSQFGTNQNTRFGTNHLGTNNQFGANRFGSNQFNRNSLATEGGILTHRSENDGVGQYSFAYETENGISHQEAGQPQGQGSYGVRGSYSYTSPEGVPVTVSYIADENGFQVDSPNVPAIPEHSQRQILAAQELRRQGLVDDFGNVLTDQQNQFQTSNLHNLVNQNTNGFGTGGRFSGSSNFAGGFNRNNQAGFGSQGFNSQLPSGNFLGTTVVRRRLPYGLDEASIAAFNRQALQTYRRDDTRGSLFLDDQRLLNDNRILRGGLYSKNNLGGLGQNYNLGQAGYSSLGTDSDRDFERIIETLNHRLRDGDSRRFSNRDGRSGTRFGEYTSQGFVSPVFQQQTASKLAIQEGGNSRQPFSRLLSLRRDDDDLRSHSDLYHASDLGTGVGGRGASHIFRS